MLEELVHHRYELPAFSTLERLAIAASEQVHDTHYRQITDALTPAMRALIAEMLLTPPGSHHSACPALKPEPNRPTKKKVRNYLPHHPAPRTLANTLPPQHHRVPKP